MPNLLAMSFEGALCPAFDLRCLHPGATRPDGWGLGYYPPGEQSVTVHKEAAPIHGSPQSELVRRADHKESSTFVLHLRTALWGALTEANTQPFARAWGGREWLFAHSGSLERRPILLPEPLFEPVGATDSEFVFCDLLNRMAARRWRSLGEADPQVLADWLLDLNTLGTLDVVLTDGLDLLAWADRERSGLTSWLLRPPYGPIALGDAQVGVEFGRDGARNRKGVIISSAPLEVSGGGPPAEWTPVPAGSLWLVRQGELRTEARSSAAPMAGAMPRRIRKLDRPPQGEIRQLDVLHRTVYRYAEPVERSTHVFRLTPMHDRKQSLLSHAFAVSVEGQAREYDDVFGNRVRRLSVNTPFTEMIIEARSRVELLDTAPLASRPLRSHSTFPLVWLPWQRNQLAPYLLPPELPESELGDLTDYAMSFVRRNDDDLFDTLMDVNQTIFEEYRYVPGSTHLGTTAYQVHATRQGVCQDFANLFICMMRLLGVPARYVSGYVYTGPRSSPPHPHAEASHAWVQVYLPEEGWVGFDPTNGILTQTDHVRVACGRAYSDATPTSGTLFVGGRGEELEVSVRVELANGS